MRSYGNSESPGSPAHYFERSGPLGRSGRLYGNQALNSTSDTGILHCLFTNRPHTFNLHKLPKIGTVLANSAVKQPPQHNSVKKVYRRQCRASNWREFGSWITTKDWSEVYPATSCISKFQFFLQERAQLLKLSFHGKQ